MPTRRHRPRAVSSRLRRGHRASGARPPDTPVRDALRPGTPAHRLAGQALDLLRLRRGPRHPGRGAATARQRRRPADRLPLGPSPLSVAARGLCPQRRGRDRRGGLIRGAEHFTVRGARDPWPPGGPAPYKALGACSRERQEGPNGPSRKRIRLRGDRRRRSIEPVHQRNVCPSGNVQRKKLSPGILHQQCSEQSHVIAPRRSCAWPLSAAPA